MTDLELKVDRYFYGEVAITYLAPLIVLALAAWIPALSTLPRRASFAVAFSWVLRNLYRTEVGLPLADAWHRANGTDFYDLLPWSFHLVLLGWFQPLMVTLLACAIILMWRRHRFGATADTPA